MWLFKEVVSSEGGFGLEQRNTAGEVSRVETCLTGLLLELGYCDQTRLLGTILCCLVDHQFAKLLGLSPLFGWFVFYLI